MRTSTSVIYLLFLIPCLLLTSLVGYTQSINTSEKAPVSENKPPNFFFGFSYIKPFNDLATSLANKSVYSSPSHSGQNYTIEGRISNGVTFEIGKNFWFEELALPKDMDLGVKFIFITPQIFFEELMDISTSLLIIDIEGVIVSSRVGPTFSQRLTKKLFLEASFLFEPSFLFLNKGTIFTTRFNPQINLRFKPIYIGFDMSLGRYKVYSERFNANQMRVILGFNF